MDTISKLMQISTPKQFKKQEYICFEGQPGDEMYVVLKGCVGVYVISALNTFAEVARINAGDLFGEMAIFDNLPRSASCVALEDTTCISIKRENLGSLITACPDIAEKIIVNMSDRIRKLNNKIYKSKEMMLGSAVPAFSLPAQLRAGHEVHEPARAGNIVETVQTACPVCGKGITITNIRHSSMSLRKIDSDRRCHYAECEPLWHYVRSCPHCNYSNYYVNFFKVYNFNQAHIAQLAKTQHDKITDCRIALKTPFDRLCVSYLQAIHTCMDLEPNNNVLIGNLWLYLYWLFTDANDKDMTAYCCEKAISYLVKAYDGRDKVISDDYSRQSVALTLANLFIQAGNKDEASRMCRDALSYPDQGMRSEAYNLKNKYSLS